jgi:predicted Zn-dependent peptidase
MFERKTLDNGVRILSEKMDGVRSASIGIWVLNGTRNEPKSLNGISHFIEHMVFKGTNSRSAAEIAETMDKIGGQVNAFTTKECTCFYARVLDTHLSTVTETLFDMVFSSRFDENDVSTEKGVILEEIGMYNDSPEDVVSEILSREVYAKTSLSMPILGTKRTLDNINGDIMRDYLTGNYLPEEIVVALSGSFTAENLSFIEKLFSAIAPAKRDAPKRGFYTPATVVKKKKAEQNHIILAFEGITVSSPERYTFAILSNILGGGMSSRLFQKVREERGLCYSIYSFMSANIDTGLFGVYTATGKDSEREALELIRSEIERMKSDGITESELERAREQCKANILLSLESSSSRMNRLARGELFSGGITTPDEIVEAYDAVTAGSILDAAAKVFDFSAASLSVVGKTEPVDYYRQFIR